MTSSLLDKYGSSSSTGVAGTACALVRVTDGEGREQARYPHVVRQALLGAATASTAEKMAKEFFGILKRVGGVALVEVASPSPKRVSVPVTPVAPVPTPEVEAVEEIDPMDALRAEMATQDDWDAETEEERLAREKKEKKERRKRSLSRWQARMAVERGAAQKRAEESAATKMAAVWRGYVCRENEKEMMQLCAEAEELASPEEEDDAMQLAELGPPQAVPEPEGMTEEELLQQNIAGAARCDNDWDWELYEEEQRMAEDLAVMRVGDGGW